MFKSGRLRLKVIFLFLATSAPALGVPVSSLNPKPAPFEKAELDAIYSEGKSLCDKKCVTPFASVLGSSDGVEAKSNCRSECITSRYLFLDKPTGKFVTFTDDPKKENFFYVGMVYQCIEYSRKWWIKNLGLTYGSVDGANEIIYLEDAQKVNGGSVKLDREINGKTKRAPKRGDLIVYEADRNSKEWRFGHVAVVVAANANLGFVDVAEENYDNKKWRGKTYARKLALERRNGGYYFLTDTEISNRKKKEVGSGKIAGWIFVP